jgi:DNA-binding NarL/FixJ family response regulator
VRALELVGEDDRFARVEGLELAVRAGVAAGELGDARAAARELAELAELAPDTPLRAAARLAAGRVAAASGAPSEAKPLLEEAVAAFEALGAPFETAVARAELGAVLRAGGRTRLAARAESQAQAALDELGARPPSSRPGGLSEREVEVLQLLVRGASNDDIARELTLSVRTVERHTANLYAKVGASGRSARAMATTWAHSHGIG